MTGTISRARPPRNQPSQRPRRAVPDSTGFRPSRRQRTRIAAGVALGAVAISGNVFVYSSLDDAEPVVQVVQDVPAGTQLRAEMLRTVDADVDGTVDVVAGDDLGLVVGQYAKVRLVAGSLVSDRSLQSDPLVEPDHAVVAIVVPEGTLPAGVRERVPVQLVVPADDADSAPVTVTGRVVGLPSATDSVLGSQSLSVELPAADAPLVAAADDVRVVLLAPDASADGGEAE